MPSSVQLGLTRYLRLWSQLGLRRKMMLIVVVGVAALISLFGYLGISASNEDTARLLEQRVILAQTYARHVDYLLASVEHALVDAARNEDLLNPTRRQQALETIYAELNFYGNQLFLLDRDGRVLAAYPLTSTAVDLSGADSVRAVQRGDAFAISHKAVPIGQAGQYPLAAAPIQDAKKKLTGALVLAIDFYRPNLLAFAQPVGLGTTGYVDLVDADGLVLGSTRPHNIGQISDHDTTLARMIEAGHTTVSRCHDCHGAAETTGPAQQVIAFAPLSRAPWGVTVRQDEAEVLEPVQQLQWKIFAVGAVALVGALALVYLTTQSVIEPVRELTVAARRIAAGDLETPIRVEAGDEIADLASAFAAMRVQLKNSIARIQSFSRELDARVQERTAALVAAQAELRRKEELRSELVQRLISAQEDERKRIARELHDETSQLLTALLFTVDTAAEACENEGSERLYDDMRALTRNALNSVHSLILGLRPTMLDQLGLVAALRWYADSRFKDTDIEFECEERGHVRRLPWVVETAIFRTIQEGISNIARHAQARRVELTIDFQPNQLEVRLQDDGVGFDPSQIAADPDSSRGLGLMSMEERITAVGGTFSITSRPGCGTLIRACVPITEAGNDGPNQGVDR